MTKINLKSLSYDELRLFVESMGLPSYRAGQLAHWIYEKKAASIDDISVLSKEIRGKLSETAYVSNLRLAERMVSSDGTEKFLFELEDGLFIESVLITMDDWSTLCISSQVGCAMGCGFCLTGRNGLKRNLRAYEILDQVIAAGRLSTNKRMRNIVLMGMGEPLMNIAEVTEALFRITELMKISPRRITVSTSGLASKMLDFAKKAPPVNIAISLNATTDASRDMIMPVNKRYPLKSLMKACREYPLQRRRRITFEYVMIEGINDSERDAERLISLIRGIPSKVNLIPLNEFEGCGFKRPPEGKVLRFEKRLMDAGITVIIRKSKGRDILAACGQLSAARGRVLKNA